MSDLPTRREFLHRAARTGLGAAGLAASIQRPGGNVNVTENLQPPNEIYGKRLALLADAVPHVSRVAYLGPGGRATLAALRETAGNLGVQLQILTPRSGPELALGAIGKEAVDAMLDGGSEFTAFQGDLPIEYQTRYDLSINLQTAAALGLTIPDALLAQATEVLR